MALEASGVCRGKKKLLCEGNPRPRSHHRATHQHGCPQDMVTKSPPTLNTHHEPSTCPYFLCDGKSTWDFNPTILGPLPCLFGTTLCRPPAHEIVFPAIVFPASPLLLFPSHLGTEQNQPRLHSCRSDYLHGDIMPCVAHGVFARHSRCWLILTRRSGIIKRD